MSRGRFFKKPQLGFERLLRYLHNIFEALHKCVKKKKKVEHDSFVQEKILTRVLGQTLWPNTSSKSTTIKTRNKVYGRCSNSFIVDIKLVFADSEYPNEIHSTCNFQ